MEQADVVVIGAGVVGLAVAAALAGRGREVVALERHGAIGTEISSRNSEVIHAGLYYPAGSLKARLCVAGRKALYSYCEERGVAHRRCGKIIVATSEEQFARLDDYIAKARAIGVDDLVRLSGDEIRALEPHVSALGGVLSPSTGIVDSHALMLALQGDLENSGGVIAFHSPLESGRIEDERIILKLGGETGSELAANLVVNSAGLSAQAVAHAIAGFPPEHIPPCHYAKGNYFAMAGASPFTHLIYPVREAGGLGVHATVDLGGQVKFGPDVEWIDEINYDVDPARASRFAERIRLYYPDFDPERLLPAYAGVRPKIVGPDEPDGDFIISTPRDHGVPGLVNLFGIESPGLTASLAIGEYVVTATGS
jgi:L-2-hydroxyglutarate oxidase LhgO